MAVALFQVNLLLFLVGGLVSSVKGFLALTMPSKEKGTKPESKKEK